MKRIIESKWYPFAKGRALHVLVRVQDNREEFTRKFRNHIEGINNEYRRT